jgi:CRISPR-associated protein Cmx8
MAKKTTAVKKTAIQTPGEIVVEYSLLDLPTAFHKAGLAGLVLMLDSLISRNRLSAKDSRYEMTATTLTVTFTEEMLQVLMDEVYDAATVEVSVRAKWNDATLKREEEIEEDVKGLKKKSKRFIYDQVQPKGGFYNNVFDGEKEVWRRLWRDMIWNVVRGKPTTRNPYNNRAKGMSSGEGESCWSDLRKMMKARHKHSPHTASLSSALFPGTQDINAERVPFEGLSHQNILLHFWPFVTLLYVPNMVERDGSSGFVGYTLAVPEVAHLADFVEQFPKLLASLEGKVRAYRPAGAVVDIAAEGALAFLYTLASVTGQQVEKGQLRYCIQAVEYLHLYKAGNNTKTLAAGRVSPNAKLIRDYRSLVSPKPGIEPFFRNPLFRSGLLQALLKDRRWYQSFLKILTVYDASLFLRHAQRPNEDEDKTPHFARDAAAQFQNENRLFLDTQSRDDPMSETHRLPVIVNRIVRHYLLARAADKSGIRLETFENDDEKVDWTKVPAAFNEAKQKIAAGLMYDFRSRKDQAFVDYFATTFFSVTQRLVEADRLRLAEALTAKDDGDREDLKALTLLSLSANS